VAAGNLAFIPTFGHIGGFLGAFADPEEGSVPTGGSHCSSADQSEPNSIVATDLGGTAAEQLSTPMNTGLNGSVAGLTAITTTTGFQVHAGLKNDNDYSPPVDRELYPGYDSVEDNYNNDYKDDDAKLRKECESKTYDDFTSSDSEWEPYGGYPDPSLSPRSEQNRRNLNITKRTYKTKAWAVKEAVKRGHDLAMTELTHPVAAVEEGIINPSGVVEPFVAPAQQLVFQHRLDTAPEPEADDANDADDDETFHSTTTQPKALIGFVTHGVVLDALVGPSDDETEDSADDDTTIGEPPSLQQREDILSDDDDLSVASSQNNHWVQGTNGRTRRRLHDKDRSYTLPQKVATTYGICQSALTWMALKGDAGQL
jgi:hypothetical protein